VARQRRHNTSVHTCGDDVSRDELLEITGAGRNGLAEMAIKFESSYNPLIVGGEGTMASVRMDYC
jgi:hypothetical protein